eukprot:4684160-Prymnesium_polylepis.1
MREALRFEADGPDEAGGAMRASRAVSATGSSASGASRMFGLRSGLYTYPERAARGSNPMMPHCAIVLLMRPSHDGFIEYVTSGTVSSDAPSVRAR